MFDLLTSAAVGAIVVYLYLRLRTAARRRRFRQYDVTDTDNQMRFIENADLYASNPINREAFKVFSAVEAWLPRRRIRYRLLAEVSMGAFVRTSPDRGSENERNRAYSAYGSKRVDFLIIDSFGRPAVAIEYHGSGHLQGNAAARDAVKKRALHKAGIELLEVYEFTEKDDYLQTLSDMLDSHEDRHNTR